MTKEQEVYSQLMLQTTTVLFTLTNLTIRRAQLKRKSPERKDAIEELSQMIENLDNAKKADEYKTLKLKVQHRMIWNRDKELRELKLELTKAKEMNEHLLEGI